MATGGAKVPAQATRCGPSRWMPGDLPGPAAPPAVAEADARRVRNVRPVAAIVDGGEHRVEHGRIAGADEAADAAHERSSELSVTQNERRRTQTRAVHQEPHLPLTRNGVGRNRCRQCVGHVLL